MIGAVTGEAIVPVLIGIAMKHEGVHAVIVTSFTISVGLVCVYGAIYRSLFKESHHKELHKVKTEREKKESNASQA
jgi:hypothetical protein